MATSKTVKLRMETIKRIDDYVENVLMGNSKVAQTLSKDASWDTKINALLDRLSEETT